MKTKNIKIILKLQKYEKIEYLQGIFWLTNLENIRFFSYFCNFKIIFLYFCFHLSYLIFFCIYNIYVRQLKIKF